MAVAGSGSSRSARPRGGGGFGRVVWWLVLIVFGFYCGVQTTKWAITGPEFARRMVGVSAPAAPAAVSPASVHQPVNEPVSSPPPTQPPGEPPKNVSAGAPPDGAGALQQPTNPNSVPGATNSTPNGTGPDKSAASPAKDVKAGPSATTSTPAKIPTDIDAQVKVYNATLRDLQQAARDYATASGAAGQGPADSSDQAAKLAEQFSGSLHQAQTLFDTITANAAYSKKYAEKEPAFTETQIPQGLPAIGADQLHFIRAK